MFMPLENLMGKRATFLFAGVFAKGHRHFVNVTSGQPMVYQELFQDEQPSKVYRASRVQNFRQRFFG